MPRPVRRELLDFIADRLKVASAREGRAPRSDRRGLRPLADGRHEDDLVRLLARVDALANFLGSEDGANLLIAYRRAGNIVRIEEKKDQRASYVRRTSSRGLAASAGGASAWSRPARTRGVARKAEPGSSRRRIFDRRNGGAGAAAAARSMNFSTR